MRYFFAILSLAIAAVLLVLGVGQRTFMAPATSIKHEIPVASADAQYAVIPAEVFSLEKGNPSVVITGDNVFLALAEQRDIDGWLTPNTYDTVSAHEEPRELNTETVVPAPAEEPATDEAEDAEGESEAEPEEAETESEPVTFADPQGSDLWLAEYDGETSLKVAVSPEPTQGVIVTSGEELTVPDEVYVIWAQERNTPLAGPLLATGALFAALGVILYIFAVDHDRRGLGPRRGRRGPLQGIRNRRVKRAKTGGRSIQSGSKRGSRLGYSAAGFLVVGLALTGCSPSYWPQATPVQPEVIEPTVEDNSAVVPVTDQQIDTILRRVIDVANEGDASLDAGVLESRFEGPALTERAANYEIRDVASATPALPYLTTDRVRYDLVQSTEKWPRTLFLTVQSSNEIIDEDQVVEETPEPETENSAETDDEVVDLPEAQEEQSPTVVLLLTQRSPHENYKVTNTVSLRGGIEMPVAAALDEGTAVLANDIKTLKLTPRETAETFAEIMQQGADNVEAAEMFNLEEEPLLDKFGINWPSQNCIDGLTCAQSVQRSDDSVTTLSTGQGGALVMATLRELHDMTIENERDQVKLSDVEKALGLDGSYNKVTREWQHNVLFFIPNADSPDPIQVLGSSTQVVDATGIEKE